MSSGFVINDTTYAGEAASPFIVKAITGNDTVQGGHIYVKDGIKKKFTIPRFDVNYLDLIQPRMATPTSKGSMTVDGRSITPSDYMIYTEFNPRDYEDHWYATQLNATLIDRSLPATVESTVVQEVLKRHNKYLNEAIWNSQLSLATSNPVFGFYDGIIKKLQTETTGTDATNVVASPTTLTVSNIQDELLKGYNKIPTSLRYDQNMKIFVSYATYDLYMQSQVNQTYKGGDITSEGVAKFKGRDVVKIANFPDNVYVIAKASAGMDSNLWMGMNSTDDATIQLARVQANSELYFIKMLMKVDVQIGWCSEAVLYGSI